MIKSKFLKHGYDIISDEFLILNILHLVHYLSKINYNGTLKNTVANRYLK